MKVNYEYYAVVAPIYGQSNVKMKCLDCGEDKLETTFNFCPKCGVEFDRDNKIEIEVIKDDVGNTVDLFA